MILSKFYPTTNTYEDFQSTALLTNISTTDYPDLLDKTKDPVSSYYMGTAPANNVLFQYDYKVEEENNVNVFKLISKNTPTKWFYYMSPGSATGDFTPKYNGTRWTGNVHFINSMSAYKMNYSHDVTMTFEYYQYLQDATLTTGEVVKEYYQTSTYSYTFQNQPTTADTNIYDFFESNSSIVLTFSGHSYTLRLSDWDEDAWCFKIPNSQDRIYLQGIGVSERADYNGQYYPTGNIKFGVAQTIETLNDGGTNLGCIYAESIHSYHCEDLRLIYWGGSQTYPLYTLYTGSLSYVNYKAMPDSQTFGKVKPFEITMSVCNYAYQRDGRKILNSNDDIISYAGYGEGSYSVKINSFTNLLGWYKTIYCLIPKTVTQKNADGATVTPVSTTNEYNPYNAVPIFKNNVPTGHMEKTNTYPTLEPRLMIWQKYNHNINENKYNPDQAPSPYPFSLWSIKETKDEKFVGGIFPYDEEDAGGGTFYAMVRPILNYDKIKRDENGNINIQNLSLTFEDVVRKSAWEDNYRIISFNWDNINSEDYPTYTYDASNPTLAPNTKEIDSIDTYELSPSINERIILENDRIKSGFYKGQLISYYNEARPSFTIKVMVEWKGHLQENPWQGAAKIVLSYKNDEGEITKKEAELDLSLSRQTVVFNVRTIDKEGKLIEYNVSEEITGEDNYWDTVITNQSIKYKQTNPICKIKNLWVKDPYDSEHPLSVPIQFKTYKYTLESNTGSGYKRRFSNNDNFISYVGSQDGFNDWKTNITDLMNEGIRENEVKACCADYIWYQPEVGPTYRFFPYLSIVKKDARGIIKWYHFQINVFTNISPNPFSYDMDERATEVNGETRIIETSLITYPYCPYKIVDRNASYYLSTSTSYYESPSETEPGIYYSYRNLGHCPENQFYKKGCITPNPYEYEITNPPYDWDDDKDIYYLEPNGDIYKLFYAGKPLEIPNQPKFTGIRTDAIISNTALSKDENNNTLLKNFRIYITDNLCLDTEIVTDGIPYYYEITVDEEHENIMKAELKFNLNKSSSFILTSGNNDPYYDPNLGPDQEIYEKHLLIDNNPNNFIIKQNNLIAPNAESIITECESNSGDFTRNYKILYGGE